MKVTTEELNLRRRLLFRLIAQQDRHDLSVKNKITEALAKDGIPKASAPLHRASRPLFQGYIAD